MRDETLTAYVRYGDFDGTVAADHHDKKALSDLAHAHGIDTERYFVIGVEVHIGETRGDDLAHTFVNILAVDTQVVKARSIGFIKQYVDEHGGALPFKKFSIEARIEGVLKYFKRFDMVLKNSNLQGIRGAFSD